MRTALLFPAALLVASLAACGGEGSPAASAPAPAPAYTAASVPQATPDPSAPWVIPMDENTILTEAQQNYSLACILWNTAGDWSSISRAAASTLHPGLIAAVDSLRNSPTAGRVAMARMCADALPD